jgi:dipeptidyl-peptidase-4
MRMLEANEALQETLARYKPPAPEFTTVPGADGTELNAYLIKPSDFDPEQTYPLLMYVYGGPGSQTVVDNWGGSRYLWHAYLADELGVIVASVDNRGTGGRGAAFKNATYKQLGNLEARDQIAAARHLGALPYIDEERIGIWGWSYGGYMTLMSLLSGDGPETFSVGLSVAPVTDWRQYDTIYTERYMSTPQQNPDGYQGGAPTTYADRLRGDQDLILVHGVLDDNVHFQNAIQMADALHSAGKEFAFMVYPGVYHSISGGNARLHLFTLLTNFVRDNLLPEGVSLNGITR